MAIAHSSDVHLLRRLGLANMGRWFAARADLVYTAEHLVIDGAPGRVVPMGIDVAEFALRDGERQRSGTNWACIVQRCCVWVGWFRSKVFRCCSRRFADFATWTSS